MSASMALRCSPPLQAADPAGDQMITCKQLIRNFMKKILVPLFSTLLMVYSSQGQQTTPSPSDAGSEAAAADNTKRSSSEQNKSTETAEQQSNSKDDLALTQQIRQAVMKEGSLSMNAENVKIIAQHGKVRLKGPLDSQQEKDTITAKAGEIAGKDKVDNQLEVSIAPCSSFLAPGCSSGNGFCSSFVRSSSKTTLISGTGVSFLSASLNEAAVVLTVTHNFR
jgi:hyperosmotically inducible periplasmic protein